MYQTDAVTYRKAIEDSGFASSGRIRTNDEGDGVRLTFENGKQVFDAKFAEQRDLATRLHMAFGYRLTVFHYENGKAVIHLSSKPEVPYNVEITQNVEVFATSANSAEDLASNMYQFGDIEPDIDALFKATKK